MARNKYPEETVQKILDVSLELFLEKGYDQTTISDIVEHLGGLSKGAIYHHFKSKEEIIDAVTTRMSLNTGWIQEIRSCKEYGGLGKLRKIFIHSISDNRQLKIYISAESLLKNPKFISRLIEESIKVSAPLVEEIIKEGNEDGSLAVKSPKDTAEITMLLFNIWFSPAVLPVDKRRYFEKVIFLQNLLENMGLPLIDEEFINVSEKYWSLISDGRCK